MVKHNMLDNGIPISISLQPTLDAEHISQKQTKDKRRVLTISLLAISVAVCISFIAKFLIYLINLVTNISFHGSLSMAATTPANNTLGVWVIFVPALGGIIIGLMALYGSKAIRGHGIPEAMEQILTNDSKIKPAITYLKPISSAIAIGTGGPFGAEGPIIATGGALGSTIGQLLKITHNERKVLLAAGATAGMAAIFGSPIAAIFLAIELLLFEFSPRSIIPVALACITGAAGHHFLFESGPVFPIAHTIEMPGNMALFCYSLLGILIGGLSVLVTKIVYFIEDLFEKLPIHWMWWPAIGGLFVGVIGYFAPRTLGVGYNNITDVLSASLPIKVMLSLCLLKFTSWAIALASGTSGGTLAPLLTIGGACGALLGVVILYLFPGCGITITLAALVGMSAMFAGASRALLTSIIFALETTGQSNAILALLAACTAAYLVSFFLMENTIMTEKIARRGVKTPDSFSPNILEEVSVADVIEENGLVLNEDNAIGEVREWLEQEKEYKNNFFIIVNNENAFKGIISCSSLFSRQQDIKKPISTLIRRKPVTIGMDSSLKTAVEMMVNENVDVLPVVSGDQNIIGVLSYGNILSAYKIDMAKFHRADPHISIKRQTLKMLIKGQKLVSTAKDRN
ncbi:MAG: chloride channel protein [Flavipsychrobacter sp.]|nr:chloride channel protein [Flavipsychrobacter sp.]